MPFQTGQANGGNKAAKWPVMLIQRAFNRASPGSQLPCTSPKKCIRLITCWARFVWRPCIAREACSNPPRGVMALGTFLLQPYSDRGGPQARRDPECVPFSEAREPYREWLAWTRQRGSDAALSPGSESKHSHG